MEVKETMKRKYEVLSASVFQNQKEQISQHSACTDIMQWTAFNKRLTSQGGRTLSGGAVQYRFPKVGTVTFTFYLQQQKIVVYASSFPVREQGIHRVWPSSKPAMLQVTAFASASPRLPRIKAKCTLTRPTHLGLLSWVSSFWFILIAPRSFHWWSRTAGYAFCQQPQHVFLQQSLCCAEKQSWKHKCCFK